MNKLEIKIRRPQKDGLNRKLASNRLVKPVAVVAEALPVELTEKKEDKKSWRNEDIYPEWLGNIHTKIKGMKPSKSDGKEWRLIQKV